MVITNLIVCKFYSGKNQDNPVGKGNFNKHNQLFIMVNDFVAAEDEIDTV